MATEELLKRVTLDPDILSGKLILRGMRRSVERILDLLSQPEYPAQR